MHVSSTKQWPSAATTNLHGCIARRCRQVECVGEPKAVSVDRTTPGGWRQIDAEEVRVKRVRAAIGGGRDLPGVDQAQHDPATVCGLVACISRGYGADGEGKGGRGRHLGSTVCIEWAVQTAAADSVYPTPDHRCQSPGGLTHRCNTWLARTGSSCKQNQRLHSASASGTGPPHNQAGLVGEREAGRREEGAVLHDCHNQLLACYCWSRLGGNRAPVARWPPRPTCTLTHADAA